MWNIELEKKGREKKDIEVVVWCCILFIPDPEDTRRKPCLNELSRHLSITNGTGKKGEHAERNEDKN